MFLEKFQSSIPGLLRRLRMIAIRGYVIIEGMLRAGVYFILESLVVFLHGRFSLWNCSSNPIIQLSVMRQDRGLDLLDEIQRVRTPAVVNDYRPQTAGIS